MNLQELLDSKVDYKIEDDSSARFHATAEINGRIIGVFFYADPGDRWELIFAEKNKKNKEIPWSHAASGSGGELKVFSLVKNLFAEFLKRRKPKEIFCSSTKWQPFEIV